MSNERWSNRHYPWVGLAALWIIGFIGAISRFILASYQVQMSEDLEMSRGLISIAWSTNLCLAALCAPVGGWLVDRYGPRRVMLTGSLFTIVGTGVVFAGAGPTFFFLGYGVIGGLSGLASSTAYVMVFQWFRRHKAKATGLLSSASSVGLAVCTPLFLSNDWMTWKIAFLASAVLGLVVTLPLILFVIRSVERQAQNEPKQAGHPERKGASTAGTTVEVGSMKVWPLAIVAFALFTCGINMGTVEMNLVAIHQGAEVSPRLIAWSVSVLGVMEIVGSLVFGTLMDAMNKRLAMVFLYGTRVLSFAILLLHAGWSPILFSILFGVTYLGAVPGGMLIAQELRETKGKLVGNLMLFHQAGGILGALIGGVSYDIFRDYQMLIGMDAVLCCLAVAGYGILARRTVETRVAKAASA